MPPSQPCKKREQGFGHLIVNKGVHCKIHLVQSLFFSTLYLMQNVEVHKNGIKDGSVEISGRHIFNHSCLEVAHASPSKAWSFHKCIRKLMVSVME